MSDLDQTYAVGLNPSGIHGKFLQQNRIMRRKFNRKNIVCKSFYGNGSQLSIEKHLLQKLMDSVNHIAL